MKTIKVIDLFSGAGGLSLGFSMAGFEVILGLDNDAASVETFSKNHPESKTINENIKKISVKDIQQITGCKKPDIIIGGPPCQGFSLSGPRNLRDPRNSLFQHFIKLTKGLKPEIIVIENVPGLVGLYKGLIKETIVKEFRNIGYSVHMEILCAANYGVPQLRKRVFFVGIRNKNKTFRFPEGSYTESKTLFGEKNFVTCEEAISDLPSLENSPEREKKQYIYEPLNKYQEIMRRDTKGIYNHEKTYHTDKVRKIISFVPEGGNYKDLPAKYKESRNFHVAWTRYHSKKPAPTIDTGHRHHFHYKYNRVPTVRECARLQSFPDNFIFYGSKTQQYKQVGNAVPPLLSKALAESLKNCL